MKREVIILTFIFVIIDSQKNEPTVQTSSGWIRGYYKKSYQGRLYEAYEGIPYAHPPVGKLRFQAPKKISPWTEELKATKTRKECIQYSHIPENKNERVVGEEDCLYLNIYVPTQERNISSLPVIFWIHGGCFQYGAGSIFGAKYLIDYNVILITVNYRLGAFGFLSTENGIVSGNMGLKDQSLALQWTYDNIGNFGGNNTKITLVGLSAGGASVHYHYLSPMSAGLFQNGISVSGTALLCWVQTEKPLQKAKKLGALMGCQTNNTEEMIECLRHCPSKSIAQATSHFMPWLYNPVTPFGPVVEKTEDNFFINKSPADLIASGQIQDVPWITGVVSEEGLYPAADFVADEFLLKYLDDNWEKIAPFLLDYNFTISPENHSRVAKKIKQHYLGSETIDKKTVKSLIQLVGDRLFVIDAEKAARMQAKSNKSPVWFYYYRYRAAQSLSDTMSGTTRNFGVSHGDDAYLVIEQSYIDPTMKPSDREMQKDLINLWLSVTKKGIPDVGVDWPQIDQTNKAFNYLQISGPGQFEIVNNNNLGEKIFWNSINFNENKIGIESQYVKEEL
ncbi:hypothetical protein TKK_0012590 [Trichogramma kaykai]